MRDGVTRGDPGVVFLVLLSAVAVVSADVQCHSCLTHCKTLPGGKVDPVACDCEGKNTCRGQACFAKIDIFTDENTAILQKGCVTDIPGGFEGCQYASNAEAIHCYCTGELCNDRHNLNEYTTNRLPVVECCACSEGHGEKCPEEKCLRKCRGNYCVVDFDGVEQGCGLGFPRLQSFLRMERYVKWQGENICARYEATQSTVMNGCTCTKHSGSCNELNRTRHYQLENVIGRRPEEQNYCYSLQHKSAKPFGEEVFRKSTTCEGQYCFISLTTSEIVLESADFEHNYEDHGDFVGFARPSYEILAGCLKVDDDKKVQVGCTTEYTTNSSDPLSKHCICESHLCNYHSLLKTGTNAEPTTELRSRKLAPTMTTHSSVLPTVPLNPVASDSLDDQPRSNSATPTRRIFAVLAVGPIAFCVVLRLLSPIH